MHKKAITFALLGASVTALAASAPQAPVRISSPAVPAVAVGVQAYPSTPAPVQTQYAPASSDIAQAVSRWRSLRQSDRLPFTSYSNFLLRYRGWPGEASMRSRAEAAISDATLPGDIITYFQAMPPLTPVGHARHAFALAASGRSAEAQEAARRAWTGGVLPVNDEARLLSQFAGALTPADHARRAARLLDTRDLASAQRALVYVSGPERAVLDTRIALQTRMPDAMSRVSTLGAAASGDAGLVMDRANWLRETGQPVAARALLAQPRSLVSRPQNVEKYYEALLAMARGAAADSQWTTAYQIASQIDDAYPAGTDVSVQSYGERDEYTSLAWLAGTTALHRLNRPTDAIGMFRRYGEAARSPQTRSKGFYWAGRAAVQAGQPAIANGFFEQAAAFPDQFYGHLALERLGRPVPPPAPNAPSDPAARAAFERRDLVQATKYLGATGQRADQSLFIRTLSEQLHSYAEREMAGALGQQIGRLDLGVWAARSARNDGATFYTRAAFPEVSTPPAYSNQRTLAHAIMRQESSFDRTAVSSADARGMMQLMNGTAAETARKLGVPYSQARLTSEPDYNILLGNHFFASLMSRYGNYAPLAIAAYNAGPGNANKWIAANGDPRLPGTDVVRWIEEIPFSETRNYVQRVLENAVVYDAMAQPGTPNRMSHYLGKRQPG